MKAVKHFDKSMPVIKRAVKLAALSVLMLACAACNTSRFFNKGGAPAVVEQAKKPVVADITRPPEIVKSVNTSNEVLDPEATISFEKWKQEQEQELEAASE